MKKIALIPARYEATRFPGKLMQLLGNKPVIRHTYDAVLATGLFDAVIVVTDSDIIYKEIISHEGAARMSKKKHESGTDRIAEAAEELNVDIIVNVQGDTPFVKKESLEKLLHQFNDLSVHVASLMREINKKKEINDSNFVKVVVDKKMNSLFFSRSILPYPRNEAAPVTYYEHIGVYAFRKKTLLDFSSWPVMPLEDAEKIECLRFLEYGIPLRMVIANDTGIEIDTPADLEKAASLL